MEYKIIKSNSLNSEGAESILYYIKKKTIFNIWNYAIFKQHNIEHFSGQMCVLQVVMLLMIVLNKIMLNIDVFSIGTGIFIFFTEVIGSQTFKYINRDVYTSESEAQEVIKKEIVKKKYVAKEEIVSHIKYEKNNLTVEKNNE